MIEMPSRSITRFFVPMIDVLTLLFCIYLLMPMVSDPSGESEASRLERERLLRQLEDERAKGKTDFTEKQLADLERLRREKAQALKSRLNVRVLEIDAADGKLYYRGLKGARVEVRSQADAHELIKLDQERTGAERRELFYLVLYPRDPKSAFPTVGQKRTYDAWFADVALGYDVPGLDLGRQP